MIPALLKWIGNKQRFAETIVSYMPTQFANYYEPFWGAALSWQNYSTQIAT